MCVSDLAVMSLLDHEDASSRPGGGSDYDPLAPAPLFSFQYPVPHPYSSAHLPHQQLIRGQPSEGESFVLVTPPQRPLCGHLSNMTAMT